jgi:Tautomerase enzyme
MPRGRRGARLELSTTRSQEAPMPLINVRFIENVFSTDQKQQIARDLTDAMVAILRVRY